MICLMHAPKATNDYIHRVGRTARAGRGGRAITLMSEHDVELIHAIEAKVGHTNFDIIWARPLPLSLSRVCCAVLYLVTMVIGC